MNSKELRIIEVAVLSTLEHLIERAEEEGRDGIADWIESYLEKVRERSE